MSTKQIEKSTTEIQIPKDVKVNLKGGMLQVQGPLGKVYKNFKKIPVLIQINDNKILLRKTGERKKHQAILNTAKSLIQTLCVGVVDGFTIKMKIVYSHFPITVKVEGKNVLIAIRDCPLDDPDEENEYIAEEVMGHLSEEFRDEILEGRVKLIIIPAIESVNYGRTVGYEIIEHFPPPEIKEISATKVRNKK